MRFPQTFIDDLRRQADIVRVINDYVTLKKKGANWMACCPFHKEKTPSFSVNPSKEIFYCFGCSKGGSVFNFVMEMESVSFPEAVRIVAEKSGVPVPVMEQDKKFEARRQEADAVIQLNAWALEWWERQLQEGNAEAHAAREYVEGRQIDDETRKSFRLGYAPNSWDALTSHLKSQGASAFEIERSGLVVKKETGGSYDRFRGRVIFPVLDSQGRPVAFGARAIRAGDEPKYLNSPETPAYTKGRHLFGLNLSREEIRRKGFAILVEGYLDLIIPYQFGVRNVVASLGTALTPEQVKILGRFARRVVVNYDGDRAGRKAAKRAIDGLLQTLISEEFDVKVLVLPGGADPDEFIRSHGVEEYNKRRGDAPIWIQFIIDQVLQDRDINRPGEKSEAVKEVIPYIQSVPLGIRGTKRREFFDVAMNALHIDQALRNDLWKSVAPKASSAPASSNEIKNKVERVSVQQPTVAEQRLLEIIIHDAELRRVVLPALEEDDYAELPTTAVFRALKELDARGAEVDFTSLEEVVGADPLAAELVPRLWMGEGERAEGEATDDLLAEAESCVRALRLMRVDRRVRELAAEIAEADRAGDEERRDRLIMEDLEWKRRKQQLSEVRG